MVSLAPRSKPFETKLEISFAVHSASSRERDWRTGCFSLIVAGNLQETPHALPHDSPDACARRRYGGEFHDRDRSDDRLHRHAADCWPARRIAALQLGVRGVPFDADRHHGGVRQARRSHRPQDGHAGRHRDLPLWLDPVRIRVVDAVADRLQARAGHRRGRGSADRHDHRRRPLCGARAGQDSGLVGQRLGGVGGPWTARRRPHHPVFFLGLDLLDESADRRARRGRILGLPARKERPRPRQNRPSERRHFHRRHRRHHGRPDRALDVRPARNRAHHPGRGGCGRAVRPAGAAISGADDFA